MPSVAAGMIFFIFRGTSLQEKTCGYMLQFSLLSFALINTAVKPYDCPELLP